MSETETAPEGVPFTAKCDFRHHKTDYTEGVEYHEPYGLVTYFVLSGWAESPRVSPSGEWINPEDVVVDLEVHDVVQTQSNEVN